MARLREQQSRNEDATEMVKTRRRRSSENSNSDDPGKRKMTVGLVPKAQSPVKMKRTQVKLGDLSSLSGLNSLASSGPTSDDLRREVARKRATVKKIPEPVITEVTLDGEAEENIDVEESIWCGSIDASESYSSSEEEMLSPRKLFGGPRKNRTENKKTGPDLSKQLQALSIFDDDEDDQEPTKKRVPRLKKPDTSSRPTSSSDKENKDAIITISPPRSRFTAKRDTTERPATPPPASPSKSKLQSPSKKVPRIPTPPLRPSLDAFWTADAINDWNDQYSPQKPLRSPKKLNLQPKSEDASPTASPIKGSPTKRTKAEVAARKTFEAQKIALAESFLVELDTSITQSRISDLSASTGGVRIIWSKTLNTTAGRANWRRETTRPRDSAQPTVEKHFASIELASKVIDSEHRLLNVLAHEFCHLANFMVSGVKDQPHGKSFKEWGRKVTKHFADRGVEVTTKHTYEIEYKYIWQCGDEGCGMEFKRHSKSIDPARHRCGGCRGPLVQIRPVPRKTKEHVPGTPGNGYAAYVKANFAHLKKSMLGASHKEVMEAVGRKYRAEKAGGSGLSVEKVAIDLQGLKVGGKESPVVIELD